jgi:hypothetical protein
VPEVVIKLAETTEEREQVFRLRYETYVVEMHAFSAAADHAARRLTEALDERSELLIACAGGQVVGTMRGLSRDTLHMTCSVHLPRIPRA